MQVEQIPIQIKEAVSSAEELLSTQLSQQYEFETQLKQKESECRSYSSSRLNLQYQKSIKFITKNNK